MTSKKTIGALKGCTDILEMVTKMPSRILRTYGIILSDVNRQIRRADEAIREENENV